MVSGLHDGKQMLLFVSSVALLAVGGAAWLLDLETLAAGLWVGDTGLGLVVSLLWMAAAIRRRQAGVDAVSFTHSAPPAGELDREVDAYCRLVAENAPLTIAAAKRAIREALTDSAERDLAGLQRMLAASRPNHQNLHPKHLSKNSPRTIVVPQLRVNLPPGVHLNHGVEGVCESESAGGSVVKARHS